jgi:hypothetical protein
MQQPPVPCGGLFLFAAPGRLSRAAWFVLAAARCARCPLAGGSVGRLSARVQACSAPTRSSGTSVALSELHDCSAAATYVLLAAERSSPVGFAPGGVPLFQSSVCISWRPFAATALAAIYSEICLIARSQSRSRSRSPAFANSIITFATAMVAGSSRFFSLSLPRQLSNAVVSAATSSGEKTWSCCSILRIAITRPRTARRYPGLYHRQKAASVRVPTNTPKNSALDFRTHPSCQAPHFPGRG